MLRLCPFWMLSVVCACLLSVPRLEAAATGKPSDAQTSPSVPGAAANANAGQAGAKGQPQANPAAPNTSAPKAPDATVAPLSKPSVTEVYGPICLPKSTDASRIVTLLNSLSIVGVSQVLAVDNHHVVFLLDRQALLKSGSNGQQPAKNKQQTAAAGAAPASGAATAKHTPAPSGGSVAGARTQAIESNPSPNNDTAQKPPAAGTTIAPAHQPSAQNPSASRGDAAQPHPTAANGAQAINPAPSTPSGDAVIAKLEARLKSIVASLAGLQPDTTTLVGLPSGVQAGALAASALNVPGVASAVAVGDGSLLVTYDSNVKGATQFVKQIRQAPLPDKHVESFTQRLYYVSGTAGSLVAGAINEMYPDVTATFLSPDLIQLSMKSVPAGVGWHQTDTIEDAKRAIAKIDQPRPRASLDAWAIQIASEEPESLEAVTPVIEEVTSAFNEVMTSSILQGWKVLAKSPPQGRDTLFENYITNTTVARNAGGTSETDCCFIGKDRLEAKSTAVSGYALGYQTMFDTVTPNLIDMLVSLAAQENPGQKANEVLDQIEGRLNPERVTDVWRDESECKTKCTSNKTKCKPDCSLKATTILDEVDRTTPLHSLLCRRKDVEIYRAWAEHVRQASDCGPGCKADVGIVVPPNLVLSCVRQELDQHLFSATVGTANTSAFGQFRAAIANFLYQYKLMMQYPNDFHAYLEPMSADTLDMALLPVVDAFYDDLGAFQEAMQDQVYKLLTVKGVSYSSSGLVSMKMIAGTQADVKSTSQNSFQMSEGASSADVAAAIASIKVDPVGASSKLLNLLTPTPVTATLGKELNVTSTVHSLSGAYGMELDLDIESAENGAPQLVKSGTTVTKTDDLNSRVTTHQLQTKVRVDNLKLFEVSTARSLVARGQAPWIPLDPYFEIPVLGQLVKRPRKPKAVYTQSLIFIDALVVPTAIDLGYGTPFTLDAVLSLSANEGGLQEVNSLDQLTKGAEKFAIEDYHSQMMNCLSKQYLDDKGMIEGCSELPHWRPEAAATPVEAAPGND